MNNLKSREISELHYDVLKEIGNIGAGNAMTALSQLLDCKVAMNIPQIQLMEFKDAGYLLGGEETIMAGVYFGIDGEIDGSIMFVIEQKAAKFLIKNLMEHMGYETPMEQFDEMDFSAIKEIGNIITGAYLGAISSMTKLTTTPTVPSVCLDMAGAILSVPASEYGVYGEKMMVIQSRFFDQELIEGYFILVPSLESYNKILGALGIQ